MYIIEILSYLGEFIIEHPVAQMTGFFGMGTVILAYLQKDDSSVKKLMLLSNLFWGAHFFFLGVYTGLAAVIISTLRTLLSFKFQKNKKIFLFITGLTLITGYMTFSGYSSLLPVIASLISGYAYFFLEKIALRVFMIFTSVLWLFYHSFIGSVTGVANEVMVLAILILTVYRMLHLEGGMTYYSQKIADILLQRSKPDYDRYIFIRDKLSGLRTTIGNRFHKILHYDLRRFFRKQNVNTSREYFQ